MCYVPELRIQASIGTVRYFLNRIFSGYFQIIPFSLSKPFRADLACPHPSFDTVGCLIQGPEKLGMDQSQQIL